MSNGHVCCILQVCCPPPGGNEKRVESLAHVLHESGRQAVEAGQTVAHDHFGETSRAFLGWDDISESARDGRRSQARYLLGLFDFAPAGSLGPLIEALRPQFAKLASAG